MRGQDIIVATPGRLLDFLTMTDYKTGNLVAKLERTFILVLDEADRYTFFYALMAACWIWVLKKISRKLSRK